MWTTVFLTVTALAQDTWEWADPDVGDRYPNVVLADLDGDGSQDLAIGTAERCGAVDVWLSTVDPRIELDGGWLGEPTWRVAPDGCDPVFGLELAVQDGVLGSSPDAGGQPTATVTFDRGPTLTLAGTPHTPSTAAACEPCCGPAPCCTTGGAGGGGFHLDDLIITSIDVSAGE